MIATVSGEVQFQFNCVDSGRICGCGAESDSRRSDSDPHGAKVGVGFRVAKGSRVILGFEICAGFWHGRIRQRLRAETICTEPLFNKSQLLWTERLFPLP